MRASEPPLNERWAEPIEPDSIYHAQKEILERAKGFEPSTPTLAKLR
jgi:hypothetical protein